MRSTKNDLAEPKRQKLIEILNARLADALDLQSQTKQAHWNVRGPNFIALHGLFDTASGEISAYADDLAERALQLGGDALGTVRQTAQKSGLPEYPAGHPGWKSVLEHLITVTSKFGAAVRQSIDQSNELGDAVSADLFTEVVRGIDKTLWFYEAHLD